MDRKNVHWLKKINNISVVKFYLLERPKNNGFGWLDKQCMTCN